MLDDDFFDIDEDLLNATEFGRNIVDEENGAAPGDIDNISVVLRELNCTGEDQLTNQSFHDKSFIMNNELKLIENRTRKFHNQKLFGMDVAPEVVADIDMLNMLINKARVNAQTLFASSRENNTLPTKTPHFTLRRQVTTFLFQLRELMYSGQLRHSVADDLIRPFVMFLEDLNALPIADILHTVHSSIGNQSTSPGHHLLHGHIEWRWIFLTIRLRIELDKSRDNLMLSENSLRNTEFEEKLQRFIYDLITISAAIFNKLVTSEIPSKSPFLCACIKEIWLLVQLLVDKFHESQGQLNSFWSYFNTAMTWLKEQKVPVSDENQRPTSVARDTVDIYPKSYTLFSLWLLHGVASLHGFTEIGGYVGSNSSRVRENSELLDSLLKAFTTSDFNEQYLRASLMIMQPLVLTWWPKKCELIMSFWEFFHKKLNSTFFESGAAPSALAVAGKTVPEYLEQAKKILTTDRPDNTANSYRLFLINLAKVIERYQNNYGNVQIMKIKGRIFSKFGESKLLGLNEIGIHNLLSLFLMLAARIGLSEIGSQVQNILLMLRFDKLTSSRQTCLMKGHLSMIILGLEQEYEIKTYINRVLDQVNKITAIETKLPLLRLLASTLEHICDKPDLLECGGLTLIDNWIVDYLLASQKSEQEKCLQSLNRLMVCIQNHPGLEGRHVADHNRIVQIMFGAVLPHVKTAYRQSNGFSCVPDIAATFCVYASGQNGLPSFKELFQYFTEASCCDIQVTTKFIVNILKSPRASQVESTAALRQWAKCCTLTTNLNDDIRELTHLIMKLDSYKILSDATPEEFFKSREPLSVFFNSCGKKYYKSSEEQKKLIASRLQQTVAGFEKWTSMTDSPIVLYKIHMISGFLIYNCPHIVYARSQPGCFFLVVMNHYLLPLSLMMGKPQKLVSVQAVHKIWHLIIGALEKLDYENDAQLLKFFNDMIIKWVPQFHALLGQKHLSKPFTTLAQNCTLLTLRKVMSTMVGTFITSQRRETHENTKVVLTILEDLATENARDREVLVQLLQVSIIRVLEHVMLVEEDLPSRAMVFSYLTAIFRAPAFIADIEVRKNFYAGLKIITTKHMSYYASPFFQLMTKLSHSHPRIIKDFMPHIRDHVTVVENLRGAGQDANLRNALLQLEIFHF